MFVSLDHSVYFAPRGRKRLLHLGQLLAQRYLSPEDRLVGLIGDAGAGKSLLIRGMFPGLVLTNDDDGINVRPLPVLQDAEAGFFGTHTYHVDVRFETAFCQVWEIADAVRRAVAAGHRVVVEHFDILYPALEFNAEILIGIGEQVVVTRPSLFGPVPQSIKDQVYRSLVYRKMAHTAEDLTSIALETVGLEPPQYHSDVKGGFVLEFREKPAMDLDDLEAKVQAMIEKDMAIGYHDDHHITMGGQTLFCSGPRLHVGSTGAVAGFRLVKEFRYAPLTQTYLLVGLVGQASDVGEGDADDSYSSG